MNKLRIVYMGTPDFSVEPLKRLNQEYDIVLVVTKPDKKVGFVLVKQGQIWYNNPRKLCKKFSLGCNHGPIIVLPPVRQVKEGFNEEWERHEKQGRGLFPHPLLFMFVLPTLSLYLQSKGALIWPVKQAARNAQQRSVRKSQKR